MTDSLNGTTRAGFSGVQISFHTQGHSHTVLSLTRALLFCLGILTAVLSGAAVTTPAQAGKVLALVNDYPVTDFDVQQKQRLNRIIGGPRDRKGAFRAAVNEAVLLTEAKKLGIEVSDAKVDKAIEQMAANMGGKAKLKAVLRKNGVRLETLRRYVRSTILFRIFSARMGRTLKTTVDEKEVEHRYRKILNDPRLKPVTIYKLREVLLPIDDPNPITRKQLTIARLAEAQQIMARYRGCGSLKKITSDIFNVRISPLIQADPRRMPKPIIKAIRKAGTKRMIGPLRAPNGVQLLAFCGTRKIVPPKPDKKVIRQMVQAEVINREVEKVMRQLRRKAYIEYKDPKLVLN